MLLQLLTGFENTRSFKSYLRGEEWEPDKFLLCGDIT